MKGLILFIKDDSELKSVLKRKTKYVSIRIPGFDAEIKARRFDDIEAFGEFWANEYADKTETNDFYNDNIFSFSDKTVEWYCPNCSQRLAEIKDRSGNAISVCPTCGTRNTVNRIGRNRFGIKLVYPKHSAIGF